MQLDFLSNDTAIQPALARHVHMNGAFSLIERSHSRPMDDRWI